MNKAKEKTKQSKRVFNLIKSTGIVQGMFQDCLPNSLTLRVHTEQEY